MMGDDLPKERTPCGLWRTEGIPEVIKDFPGTGGPGNGILKGSASLPNLWDI